MNLRETLVHGKIGKTTRNIRNDLEKEKTSKRNEPEGRGGNGAGTKKENKTGKSVPTKNTNITPGTCSTNFQIGSIRKYSRVPPEPSSQLTRTRSPLYFQLLTRRPFARLTCTTGPFPFQLQTYVKRYRIAPDRTRKAPRQELNPRDSSHVLLMEKSISRSESGSAPLLLARSGRLFNNIDSFDEFSPAKKQLSVQCHAQACSVTPELNALQLQAAHFPWMADNLRNMVSVISCFTHLIGRKKTRPAVVTAVRIQ